MLPPHLSPLNFDDLAHRLLRDLAGLIHSGAETERRLAGVLGLSQSHLHNVLNGVRKLTPAVADQVMERLDWSLLDLVETNEALALVDRRQAHLERGRDTPFVCCGVGVGLRFPGKDLGRVMAIPGTWLDRTEDALAVSAGEDSEMDGIIETGDILLVDRSPQARTNLHEDALYVVRTDDESVARWVRFSSRGLYLVSASTWSEPSEWTQVVLPARCRHEIIEGLIIALVRPPARMFQRPARPFASN